MTNAQTCLYLLKCARMTMLTAWPNIRKSLLHLMLLAELFSKGRAGKIVMPPWASGWSGREISHAWLRDANESLAPYASCPTLLPPCLEWPGTTGPGKLSVSKQPVIWKVCNMRGPSWTGLQKEAKMPLCIWLVRLCSGCTRNAQGESPATPRMSCVPDNRFQMSHFPEGGIFEQEYKSPSAFVV